MSLSIQADKDDNGNVDFDEFQSLWNLVMGELEVQIKVAGSKSFNNSIRQDDPEIRKEFERFDLDKNGFITKSWLKKFIE